MPTLTPQPTQNFAGMGPVRRPPQPQLQTYPGAPSSGMGPYGYGQTPGSGPGYYEQQTPVGSFVAGQASTAYGRPDVGTSLAHNPYIGATAAGAAGQASTLGYGTAAARYGMGANARNPYLGGTTERVGSAGTNPYAGANPYLQSQIDATTADASKTWSNTINPQFDRMAIASGSFGNTGVEQARGAAMGDFGKTLANTIGGMRMQDYIQQQGLAENALNRNQQVNLANAGFNAGDLSRNLGGYLQGQGLGMQGLGMQMGAAQFDANLGQGLNTFNATLGANDLARNANLSQNMGQFNAGAMNNMGQFNNSQGNTMSMFNAGQGNAMSQFNAGQGNQMLGQYRTQQEQGRQFDANLDWGIDRDNWNRQRTGMQDSLGIFDRMVGNTNQGFDLGTALQNMPLAQQQAFTQLLTQLGGLGGSSTNAQQLQGNPLMGGLGGWLAMQQLFGGK